MHWTERPGILGFAGPIVALAPSDDLVASAGRAAATHAGIAALWAFWPRKFQVIDLYMLRQKYLTAEAEFSRLVILDTQVSMIRKTASLLQDKVRRLMSPLRTARTPIWSPISRRAGGPDHGKSREPES
jgi:hypothetical protein